MRREPALMTMALIFAALVSAEAAWADAYLWANRERDRVHSTVPGHQGLDTVTNLLDAFPSRQVGLVVVEDVDPARNDCLVGTSSFKFLGISRWGWHSGNLFNADIAWSASPPQKIVRGALHELNVLEAQGQRIMADFIWPLFAGDKQVGVLVLRCAIRAAEPSWVYARTFLAGDPRLVLRSFDLLSYGGAVTRTQGYEQGIYGLSSGGPAPAPGLLALDQYWFFAARPTHTLPDLERRGAAGVFLPEQLQGLSYLGGGSVRLTLLPDSRFVSWAICDFYDTPDAWIDAARAAAGERRQRLAEMAWHPDMKRELQALDAEANPLLEDLAPQSPVRQTWQGQRAELERVSGPAEGAEVGTEEELAFGSALQTARAALNDLWQPALKEIALARTDR